jgi:hypothetical protein
MTTRMVRKQIYLQSRQNALLKRLARVRGLSEAEIIRQAIEREISGVPVQPAQSDRAAWQELIAFLDARQQSSSGGQPYRWNREDIYAERENRWLRDRQEE